MDLVRESQESFTADVSQDGAGEWRDDVGAKYFEVHQEENLSGPAESAFETLPEEEGIEVALVTTERRLSCLTRNHTGHKNLLKASAPRTTDPW